MTVAVPPSSRDEPGLSDLHTDLEQVRLGQARLLRDRTGISCLIIGIVILYLAVLILLTGDGQFAAIWVAATGSMVGLVYVYPRLAVPDGVSLSNHARYLRGHIVISALTGLVWSGLAIAFLDDRSLLNLFIAINMVFSITVGGMMPSAEYRASFIAIASATLLPFATYWLVSVEGALRLIGIGLLIYYAFGLLVSARAEIQTRATIAADRNRELTRRLQEQNALIEKVSAEKSRFLAATSHDLSQPLQAQGFFIGAMRNLLERADQIELLDKIEACWSSQQQLLQALVDTARLDSGAIVAKPRPFALADTMDALHQEFTEPARVRDLTLTFETTSLQILSDPLLVSRILRNLLGNAVKFTPAGGHIRVGARQEAEHVLVEVSDDGAGIPAEAIDRVFDEYVQLDTSQSETQTGLGLGLGLPIVRQLARKLDARLEFQSEPGQGTTARIYLPLADGTEATTSRTDAPTRITGSPLVVLVEDDAAIREALTLLLTDWHCQVVAAGSGAEAVELLAWATTDPVLLIADKRLADGEDGLETIATLRAELALDTPAVLLTGDVYQFEKLASLPDITVITKPADPARLQEVLLETMADRPGDT